MIIKVKEEISNGKSYYIKTVEKNGETKTKIIDLHTACVKTANGNRYSLYDSSSRLISPVYEYVNYKCNSDNSKIAANRSMRLFFSYLELTNKTPSDIKTKVDVNNLISFLKGVTMKGNNSVILRTSRTNISVNDYLSYIKQYYRYLEIYDTAILQTKDIRVANELGGIKRVKASLAKLPTVTNDEVPDYISAEEFIKLIKIVKKKYTIREEIMIRLMYQMGLRIGEVLSLTMDDIGYVKRNFKDEGRLILRNRVAKNKHQKCKNLMTVNSIEDYKLDMYSIKKYGYSELHIANGMIDLIDKYIETEHLKARRRKSKTYNSKTIADRVMPKLGNKDNKNHYLMLGDKGGLLNYDTWNDILKEIYKEAGLALDIDKKKHNLNHRLRHGFAMYHIQFKNVRPSVLQKYMRHRDPRSVMIYYRPTMDDIAKVKDIFEEKLFKDYGIDLDQAYKIDVEIEKTLEDGKIHQINTETGEILN